MSPELVVAPNALSRDKFAQPSEEDEFPTSSTDPKDQKPIQYDWVAFVPFVLAHIVPFFAIFTGVSWADWLCCFALYFARMFGVTGGYHRLFAHRTYETSRPFAFFMAFLAQSSSQKGALWWAANHRHHHLYSDKPNDLHSPVQHGFWHSHVGWIYSSTNKTDWKRIRDWQKYPELVWLDKYWFVSPIVLATVVYLLLGASGLFIGFFLSTVLCWHGTFTINSLSHVFGKRRFETKDDSRNNWLLAIVTMGEGWHNNHHHYMRSVRQGFYFGEIDMTYGILLVLSRLGIVWDLKMPPERILAEGRSLDVQRKEQKRRKSFQAPAQSALVHSIMPSPLSTKKIDA